MFIPELEPAVRSSCGSSRGLLPRPRLSGSSSVLKPDERLLSLVMDPTIVFPGESDDSDDSERDPVRRIAEPHWESRLPAEYSWMKGKDVFMARVGTLRKLCRQMGLEPFGAKMELIQRVLNPETAKLKFESEPRTRASTAVTPLLVVDCKEEEVTSMADFSTDISRMSIDYGNIEAPKKEMSPETVDKLLLDCGFESVATVNSCLKAAIQLGYIEVDAGEGVSQIIYKGTALDAGCNDCGGICVVTLQSFASQTALCGMEGDGAMIECGGICEKSISSESAAAKCCANVFFVGACIGQPQLRGLYKNYHCQKCPGFGQCQLDRVEEHCEVCGEHFDKTSPTSVCDNCGECDTDEDDLDWEKMYNVRTAQDQMSKMIMAVSRVLE